MGVIVACVGVSLLLPMAWSIYYGDGMLPRLFLAMVIIVGLGLIAFFLFRSKDKTSLTHREGMAAVGLSWFFIGLAVSFPYMLCGDFNSFTDAVFESVSGITTTGATILGNVEGLPKSILMWRALSQWLGGMGIIVLSLAILPFLGVGGMQLYKAEVTGPFRDKLKPRIKDTASVLWKVYVLLTVIMTILLLLGGMNLYNALCHTFATVATGGFSTWNNSVAHYPSAYIQWVIIIFMFLGGVSFSLHYAFLNGDYRAYFKNSEFRFYLGVVVFASLTIAFGLYGSQYSGIELSVRTAAFQVVSLITTTGFATADYEQWSFYAQALLVLLLFIGGCGGSTAGGLKCMRVVLLIKYIYHEIYRLVHPRAVRHVKMGNEPVSPDVLSAVSTFFILYLGIFVVSSLALTIMGVDLATSFTAVATCMGNVGPGLGSIGPVENFGSLPALAKWLLSVCMLIGRLEIYTVLLLFIPEFWRR